MLNNPVIYLFRKMWKYSDRRSVVFYIILSFLANILWLLEPFVIAYILNIVQKDGVSEQNMVWILLLLFLLVGFNVSAWIFHGPSRVMENKNAFFVGKNYKQYLMDNCLALPIEWHTNHHSGDTIDKIEKGVGGLHSYSKSLFEITSNIMRLVVGFAVLAFFNIHSTYILIILTLLTVILITKFDKILVRQYDQLNKDYNVVSAKVYDSISNITTIIVLRVASLVSKSIEKKMQKPFSLYQENSKLNEIKWFLVSLCAALTQFFVLGSYIIISIRSHETVLIGTLFLLYQYVSTVVMVFYNFAWLYSQQIERGASVKNAEILEKDFGKVRTVKSIDLAKSWSKDLTIKNLNFSYHTKSGASLHVDDISFTIRKGEKVAFIGESGSGKTTILKLMRGLYAPHKLELFIDNKKISGGFEAISNDISLIPQEPELFATTIRDNITFGIPYRNEEVRKFTELARFDSVVNRLPQKYHSSIVEKGVNLSGGEKQRLALARGLLASKNKEIILMDEPTSSVDVRNERSIYEQVFKIFHNKTIISSIHRLHLLPMFDRVIMFQDGKIVANDSFGNLLSSSVLFRDLWEKHGKK